MEGLLDFLSSRNGRITRIVIGTILLIIGFAILFNGGALLGAILVVIGAFPTVAGALDMCFLAPFFGKPLKGPEFRGEVGKGEE